MGMAAAASTGRRLYEAIAWSLIVAAFVVLLGVMGIAAASDLVERADTNCRKAFGLPQGHRVARKIDKSFSLSPLGWDCTYKGGDGTRRSFIDL